VHQELLVVQVVAQLVMYLQVLFQYQAVQEIHPLYHHLKVLLEELLMEDMPLQEVEVLQQQEEIHHQEITLHLQLVVREPLRVLMDLQHLLLAVVEEQVMVLQVQLQKELVD
tara:strand:- start:191 stop:526 length:336 start_codon:yes stop_codon:yes gene_type:complete